MKSFLKKIIPRSLLQSYHQMLALFAASWYGHPSDKLIVIGVTGTNGKSTTVEIIARIFEAIGARVGFTSTVRFKIAEREWLNNKKMTMLGRFALQKLVRDMVRAGCKYAVIETSSEGIAQYRHLGINYDVAVFLNITPEHIESHGSFENYRAAKAELFAHLSRRPRKKIDETTIPKIAVVNLDDENASYFLQFKADQKMGFATREASSPVEGIDEVLRATQIEVGRDGNKFSVAGVSFRTPLRGAWNVSNAMAGIAVGTAFGLPLEQIRSGIEDMETVPGRMEFIDEGQPFTVVIDYAPQPQSVAALYDFLRLVPRKHTIHVIGSAGGGRDKSRRPILGELAAKNADVVIVTNEDPYDEDPMTIINQVAEGAERVGKKEGENLFRILDRVEAVKKAVSLAEAGDLVVLTGKGAEQAIVVKNGKKIPYDEREVVRRFLKRDQ